MTSASAGSLWGESYSYDGFGNLTAKTATQSPAPVLGVSYDVNNHQLGLSYDANGNQMTVAPGEYYAWNVENRLATSASEAWPGAETWYSYDPWGRRVMKDVNPDPQGQEEEPGYQNGSWEFYFYGITGQKLLTVDCSYSDGQPSCMTSAYYKYFAGKLVQSGGMFNNGDAVLTDRLGSVRMVVTGYPPTQVSYFPYGEERTSTPDGTEKFGTYFRDGPGQDYAEQRYYNNGTGRFWSPDPGGARTANPRDPITWNRYAYTRGDPVNRSDRRGFADCLVGDPGCATIALATGDGGNGGPCDRLSGMADYFGGALEWGFVDVPDPGCPIAVGGYEGDDLPPAPPCPPRYQNFINAYRADALAAGLPEANTLALTSIESNWGTGRFAEQGNDFFNLETFSKSNTATPGNKYAYQLSWIPAYEMKTSGPLKGYYAWVATYSSAKDSFLSAAAQFSNLTATNPTTFAQNAVADGINAGGDPNFLKREKIFAKCLGGQ